MFDLERAVADWRWRLRTRMQVSGETIAELEDHLRTQVETLGAGGLSQEEAFQTAVRRLGDESSVRSEFDKVEPDDGRPVMGPDHSVERIRGRRGISMRTFFQDIRYSLRLLRQSPSFAVVAILTLALGIGANTAVFSVVNAVLVRPLPYEDPEQLTVIWTDFGRDLPQNWVSGPELVEMQEFNSLFEAVGAVIPTTVAFTGSGEPEQIRAAGATGNFFRVMKVNPAQGRLFRDDDDVAGAAPVAVLSDGFWKRRFGGDRSILGQTISTDGVPLTVVGILPADFAILHPGSNFPKDIDVWTPMAGLLQAFFGTGNYEELPRGSHFMNAFARMKPGVTLAQAQSDMSAVALQMQEKTPDYYDFDGWGITVLSLHGDLVEEARPAMLVLLGAVAFVLLIACVNVANLMLARAASREREGAVRAALGAGRWRMIRQLMTESVTLSVVGGAFGLLMAFGLVRVVSAMAPASLPRGDEIGIDSGVLLFTLVVSIGTGILFGFAPALHNLKGDLVESLKEGGRGATGVRGRRLHSLLVVSEVTLAIVLLVGAGLMIRSFSELMNSDPGYNTENLLTMRVSLPGGKYDGNGQRAFFDSLLERTAALPGVLSAGAISHLPLSGIGGSGTTRVDRTDQFPADEAYIEADRRYVSPDYFPTMGVRLVAGRNFTSADAVEAPLVAVVDEEFAGRFWPDDDPVGKHISIQFREPVWREVVGVVAHSRHTDLETVGREQVYMPYKQVPQSGMFLTLKTQGDPLSLASAVRTEVWALDDDQPVDDVATMASRVEGALGPTRFNLMLLSVFATLALLLAAVGVYGVVSYSVTQRNHEIGVRMALGAGRGDVQGMILRQSLTTVVAGLVFGLVAALGLTRFIASLLYNVSPNDPPTYAWVALVLTITAALACYLPALRATRVDPGSVLHQE